MFQRMLGIQENRDCSEESKCIQENKGYLEEWKLSRKMEDVQEDLIVDI